MNRQDLFYMDAINGTFIDIELRDLIPSRYQIVTNNGESSKFDLGSFIGDYSRGTRLRADVLSALYEVLLFGPEARKLYEGFEPKCREQRLYEEHRDRYAAKQTEKLDGALQEDSSESICRLMSAETAAMIDFNILHTVGCNDKSAANALSKGGFLPKECFIPTEQMEKKTECRKTEKLFEAIGALMKKDKEK